MASIWMLVYWTNQPSPESIAEEASRNPCFLMLEMINSKNEVRAFPWQKEQERTPGRHHIDLNDTHLESKPHANTSAPGLVSKGSGHAKVARTIVLCENDVGPTGAIDGWIHVLIDTSMESNVRTQMQTLNVCIQHMLKD